MTGRAISGLTVDQLTSGLETAGMECAEPTTAGTSSQWVCTGGVIQQRVEIDGTSPANVTGITTTIPDARGNEALVTPFLVIVIELLPIDQGTAMDVQEWITDNLETGGTETFDDVMVDMTWQGNDLTVRMTGA
jgi:hypothetical protein